MKRFYNKVDLSETEHSQWQVTLDGRGLKTVKGTPQIVPTHALAEKLAAEWAEQGEELDTNRFVFRDMADYAIDVIAPAPSDALTKLLGYGETDTLCYRADPEDALYVRQQEVWEPLLTQLEQRIEAKFVRVSGIVHRPQPQKALTALRAKIEKENAFVLAGLETMASLAASLSIALLASNDDAVAAALWQAASLEEEWQADLWGRDYEAEERREKRRLDFLGAHDFVKAARG